MDALRKVYHRAVQIPLDNVERLWQELETFETNLNKITAKKFMADLSPAHMQARTVLRQLTNHLSGLFPSSSPTKTINGRQEIWLPTLPKFDQAERTLVGKWKAYLKWEESNPLEIEDKDKTSLITRLQGVYRKAVIRMRYYSEIWYDNSNTLRVILNLNWYYFFLFVRVVSGTWRTFGPVTSESLMKPSRSSKPVSKPIRQAISSILHM